MLLGASHRFFRSGFRFLPSGHLNSRPFSGHLLRRGTPAVFRPPSPFDPGERTHGWTAGPGPSAHPPTMHEGTANLFSRDCPMIERRRRPLLYLFSILLILAAATASATNFT